MRAVNCKLPDLLEFIKLSYSGDKKGLNKYLDPINSIDIKSTDDAAIETEKKLIEFIKSGIELYCYSVLLNTEKIGYFCYFYNDKANAYALVSFGMRMADRTPINLKSFYSLIKNKIGGRFYCQLWSKNERAIKWLIKSGMKYAGNEHYKQNELTNLVCLQ